MLIRLKRYISVVAHTADDVELRVGAWNPTSWDLSDSERNGTLARLLTALDGTRSPAALAKELGIPRSRVEGLIDQLIELGILEGAAETALDQYVDLVSPALKAYTPARRTWSDVNVTILGDGELARHAGHILAESLGAEHVHRLGPGDEIHDIVAGPVQQEGLPFEERAQRFAAIGDGIVLMLQDQCLPTRSLTLNRLALAASVPVIHACVDGPFLLVGPTVLPVDSPCFECFETRVMMNMRDVTSYKAYKNALALGRVSHGRFPGMTALASVAAGHAALEALNLVATGAAVTVGKVLSIYLPTMEIAFNEVQRLPGCPACGSVSCRDEHELYFDVQAML